MSKIKYTPPQINSKATPPQTNSKATPPQTNPKKPIIIPDGLLNREVVVHNKEPDGTFTTRKVDVLSAVQSEYDRSARLINKQLLEILGDNLTFEDKIKTIQSITFDGKGDKDE